MAEPVQSAPPATPALPPSRRFAYFDSLRAIAVVAILVHHIAYYVGAQYGAWYSGFAARLGVGVTLFFLISGFLLYRPYAVSMLGGGPAPGLRTYALRRAARILPAYWIALTCLALWPGLPGVFGPDWWAYYGLLQSWSLRWLFGGLGPAWSLSVEVAFYAALPLLAFALARTSRALDARRRLGLQLSVLLLLAAAGLGYRTWSFLQGPMAALGTSLPAFLLWFALGMALAALSAWYEGREAEWAPARLVARRGGACWALAFGILVSMALSDAFPRPFSQEQQTLGSHVGEHVLYGIVALLVMLPAVFGERAGGLPRALMGARPLLWLGSVSYGLFLWHAPLLHAFQQLGASKLVPGLPFLSLTLVGVPVVLACAWASWRLVERPLIRLAHAAVASQRP